MGSRRCGARCANAQQARSANPLARHGFRGFLRLAAVTPPLRKAMAAGLGA